MNKTAQIIKNRLSLRKPQTDSLEILEKVCELLELNKAPDLAGDITKIKAIYPTCTNFERDFPSVCFALATGVGKTRLMGAFISYLYMEKGIKNFFVLAPNLTIYDKLIDDLSNTASPKYVFKGISDFAVTPPRIITGDNYAEARQIDYFKGPVSINIFNISKINSEVRGGREPKIKRLAEVLGQSYFDYLASLPDLVLLMDESHHYRADAGLKAINELKPILGLELTATPIDKDGEKFKNVVFDYPLALALKDGFVKEPAVATRKNFNPDQYKKDPKELDLIKLEDGLRIHEDTKVALELYSRDSGKKLVRPFVLVVTKDTEHAKEIKELMESDKFFKGSYRGKVMEIHSAQRGEEKEENIQRLLQLEKPDNQIEIVIHVNMLKEGWDVTNLYTIIPLRAANAQILVEQTIGRGLRLPYGVRTGNNKVDKLTIIAHDKFQAIVEFANQPGSIIRKENIIEIDPSNLPVQQEVVVSPNTITGDIEEKQRKIDKIENAQEKEQATITLEAEKQLVDTINDGKLSIQNINELNTADGKKKLFEGAIKRIKDTPQQNIFEGQLIKEMERLYEEVVKEVIEKIISIPKVTIQKLTDVKCGFKDFNLDLSGLNFQPVEEEILIKTLRTNDNDTLENLKGEIYRDTPENIIINKLLDHSDIDYDRETELLNKIVKQAVAKLGVNKTDKELRNVVLYFKGPISSLIYYQMQDHFFIEEGGFEDAKVSPFTKIESHNYSKIKDERVYLYTETIEPTNTIPSKLFGGFKKACNSLYKFDSKTEKEFATILEQDKGVIKWLRPAQAQFAIYWHRNNNRYTPDFVVETKDAIYMVEIKAEKDIDDKEVQEKAEAAKKYCQTVSEFNSKNAGKEWTYVLIPHTAVLPNSGFEVLIRDY